MKRITPIANCAAYPFLLMVVCFFISSCCKEGKVEPLPKSERLAKYEELGDLLFSVIPEGDPSLEECAAIIEGLNEVSEAHVEDGLVYFTTNKGVKCRIDINGTSITQPIEHSEFVDTCGNAIRQYIDEYINSNEDYLSELVDIEPIDDITIEEHDDESEDRSSTKASTVVNNRKVLAGKTMAFWSPWNEFYHKEASLFRETVSDAGFTCKIFEEFTPSSLATFGDYDLVFISSHGAEDGSLVIPNGWADYYVKPYPTDEELKEAGIIIQFQKINGKEVKDRDHIECIALMKNYLTQHLPDLSNTILFTSACYAGKPNSALLFAATSHNCLEFYGGDNPVTSEGPMSIFRVFVPLLSVGASTKTAYEGGLNNFNYFWKYFPKYHSYNYLRYGNKNVTYIVPSFRGVSQISSEDATVGVRFDFSLDIPGSVLDNTANTLGVRITNNDNSETVYIPLSATHILSNKLTKHDNLFYSYTVDCFLQNLKPSTSYECRAYVDVKNKRIISKSRQVFRTKEVICPDNNHPHAIDLGFGTCWSCCNLGAKHPFGKGDYYAWGETHPKSDYSYESYKWWDWDAENHGAYGITKYNDIDHKYQLDLADDAAHANLGGSWRMPTYNDFNQLVQYCSFEYKEYDDLDGYIVTSNINGNRIFLPFAGCADGGTPTVFYAGYYFSSTLGDGSGGHFFPIEAYILFLTEEGVNASDDFLRVYGHSVRPVY